MIDEHNFKDQALEVSWYQNSTVNTLSSKNRRAWKDKYHFLHTFTKFDKLVSYRAYSMNCLYNDGENCSTRRAILNDI